MRRIRTPKDPNNPNPITDDAPFNIGSRFEDDSILSRVLGGRSRGLDFGVGQNVMQDVFSRGAKLDPNKYSLDQQLNFMKDAVSKLGKELANLLPPDIAEEVKRRAGRTLEIWGDLQQKAQGMRARGETREAAKAEAAAKVFLGGGVASTLDVANQNQLLKYAESLANDPTKSARQARALMNRAAAGLNSNEILAASNAGRFFTEGYYKSYMASSGKIEAGSAQFNKLASKSRQAVAEGVRGLRRAESYRQLGGFGRMLGGISAKDLGIDEGRSRRVLGASLKASKDRLREINETERRTRAAMANATRGKSGEARRAAAKPFEEKLDMLAESRKSVSSTALEAAKELSENIKKPFMEAGASFKSAMSGVVNMLGRLGSEISRQISGLAKATLNPVVSDLVESIKYGLGIGMQAGSLIMNATKSTLDGLSKVFGIGGGLAGLFSGGLGPAMANIGKFLKGAAVVGGGAALGFGVGELIRGGISKDAREGRVEMNEAEKRTNVWAGTAQGAITGAAMGFQVGGGWGALAGAVIGGGIGWFNSKNTADKNAEWVAEQKKQQEEAKEAELKNNALSAFIPGIASFADLDKYLGVAKDTVTGAIDAGKEGLSKIGDFAKPALDTISAIGDQKLFGNITGKDIGAGLLATGGAGVLMGNLPGAAAARAVAAGGAGLLGAGFIGASATVVDFFIKSLQRGAEELGKFNQVSNNLNIGMAMQLRRIGNTQGAGLGDTTNLTEADLAQALLTSTRLIDIGFTREQVGAAYGTINRSSYAGTADATKTIELAGRTARQLGVDINEMVKSFAETDVLAGTGKGAELYNKILFGVAPRTEDGNVSAMSKAYTEAILNSARQLQMGAKTTEAGTSIAGALGALSSALKQEGGSFSEFAKFNPQVIGESFSNINSFLKGALSGDPLALNFAARAGFNRQTQFEGIKTAQQFEASINTIAGMLGGDGRFIEGGKITPYAKQTIVPELLTKFLPGMSIEQFSTFFSMASSGKISEAYEQYKKEGGKPMSLEKIAEQIGTGFVSLQAIAEEGMQQNLQLMEGNLDSLKALSKEATDTAGKILAMGKDLLRPAIDSLRAPLTLIGKLMDSAKEVLDKANAEKDQKQQAGSYSGGPISLNTLQTQLTKDQLDTAQERIAFSRNQILQASPERLAEGLKTGRTWALSNSKLDWATGDLEAWDKNRNFWTQLFGTPILGVRATDATNDKKGFLTEIFKNLQDEGYKQTAFRGLSSGNFVGAYSSDNIITAATFTNLKNKNLKIGGIGFEEWFNTREKQNMGAEKIMDILVKSGIDFETAKKILQAEAINDILLKAREDKVDISDTAALLAYAGGGANTSDKIYQAIASGKYVFLANDMQILEASELLGKFDNVK